MPTSEALRYQAMCAFLLSAPGVIKWSHLNLSSPGPLDTAPGPHLVGEANDILLNSPTHFAVYFTGISSVFSANNSAAPPKSRSPMADSVFDRVWGLPLSSFSVPSSLVKTSPAANEPFRRSL